ncbi:MAG: helix-turn-helix transcriptional regulator [Christensenellales bacterium]|jgi:predicted transcriptional regulator
MDYLADVQFLSLWHKKDLMLRELVLIVILTTTVEVDIMSGLIDLIFFSEIRKEILILLTKGPKSADEIRNELKGGALSIMPQLKKLKDMDIIVQKGDIYELSDIGKIIGEKILPLNDLLQVFEENKDYWSKHDRRPIPEHLIKKIHMLGKCKLNEPDLNHLFEFPKELKDILFKSQRIRSFYSFFCPDCPSIQATCAENGTKVDLILDEKVYLRLKNDFKDIYRLLLENNISLYIYRGKIKPSSFIVSNEFIMLKLFGKEGEFDHRNIMSFNNSAIEWGNELADYYIGLSEKVN